MKITDLLVMECGLYIQRKHDKCLKCLVAKQPVTFSGRVCENSMQFIAIDLLSQSYVRSITHNSAQFSRVTFARAVLVCSKAVRHSSDQS